MNDKNLDDKFRKALLFYHTGQLATVALWLIGKKYLVMKFMKLIYEDLVKKSEKIFAIFLVTVNWTGMIVC
tara:strand:- start:275 stop:487 length:213 start_codon:yes stop_codon:yes gene_type:complete